MRKWIRVIQEDFLGEKIMSSRVKWDENNVYKARKGLLAKNTSFILQIDEYLLKLHQKANQFVSNDSIELLKQMKESLTFI